MNNKSINIKKITLAGLFTALTTVATLVIRIPTPTKGYVNLGDSIVNLSAWTLGPVYGTAASGIGSALADMIGGYFTFAPATLIIKSVMAIVSYFIFRNLSKHFKSFTARIAAAVIAEIIMVVGYTLFETFLYGSLSASLIGVPANLVQGVFGAAASIAMYEFIIKHIADFNK